MCAHRLIAADEHVAPIRQIHSLRKAEIELAADEMIRLSPIEWEIDQHDDCDGNVMLIFSPTKASAVTFVLTRAAYGIQLAIAGEDLYEPLGRFNTVTEAIQALHLQAEDETASLSYPTWRERLAGHRHIPLPDPPSTPRTGGRVDFALADHARVFLTKELA